MEVPPWLSALASLTSLVFEVPRLVGEDNAARLAGLPQLRELTLRVHQVLRDEVLPAGLHGLPHLTALGLPGSPAAGGLSQLGALHSLRWYPNWPSYAQLPACILDLSSLRSLVLTSVFSDSMNPAAPCWAGLTHLYCLFRPHTPTLPPALALATALEHLALNGLVALDAAAPAMLARLPALRRLGLSFPEMKPCPDAMFALGQACPHVSLYDSTPDCQHPDYDEGFSDFSDDDDIGEG